MTVETIKIMLIEDNPGDVRLLQVAIEHAKTVDFELISVATLDDAISLLASSRFDLVLVDLNLPDSFGYDTFLAVKAIVSECPIVILSGEYNETLAIDSIRDGAQDYLVKGEYNRVNLIRAMRYAIERKRMEIDVTDRQRRLSEAHRLLKLGDWVWVVSTGEQTWSEETCRMFGVPKDTQGSVELYEQFVHPDDTHAVERQFQLISNGQQEVASKYRIIRQTGEVRYIESHLKAVSSSSGELIEVIGTNQDVTERAEAEDARNRALSEAKNANQAKSNFLASMSHELRTPLNAITGFSEVFIGELFGSLGSDKYKEYAFDIHASSEHLLNLVNDILDLSMIETGRISLDIQELDVSELLNECSRFIIRDVDSKHIQYTIKVPADIPILMADKRSMKQIIINLLSNALKFTPDGGEISLHAKTLDGFHVFIIQDNGDGIDEQKLATITEPFVTKESDPYKTQPGYGLGLAIVKSLVDSHQGYLDIQSQISVGTTVTVKIPTKGTGLTR